jgi:hypothetical protein
MNMNTIDIATCATIVVLLAPVAAFVVILFRMLVDFIASTGKSSECCVCDHECNQGRSCKHDK